MITGPPDPSVLRSIRQSSALETRFQDLSGPLGLHLNTPQPFNALIIPGHGCLDCLRLGPRRHAEQQDFSQAPDLLGASRRPRRAWLPHLG